MKAGTKSASIDVSQIGSYPVLCFMTQSTMNDTVSSIGVLGLYGSTSTTYMGVTYSYPKIPIEQGGVPTDIITTYLYVSASYLMNILRQLPGFDEAFPEAIINNEFLTNYCTFNIVTTQGTPASIGVQQLTKFVVGQIHVGYVLIQYKGNISGSVGAGYTYLNLALRDADHQVSTPNYSINLAQFYSPGNPLT